jgi:hypothetical protein
MEFMLLFAQPREEIETYADPVKGPIALEPWKAYMGAMAAAGIMRGGNRLQPASTATTLRTRNGKRQVQDGPFADSKEQASGYVIIDVPSLDEALKWAERSPSTVTGSTEVRPIATMGA